MHLGLQQLLASAEKVVKLIGDLGRFLEDGSLLLSEEDAIDQHFPIIHKAICDLRKESFHLKNK